MPTTMPFGRPENFCSAQTIASSGLVMQMTNAFGAYFLIPAPTCSITLRLMPDQIVAAHARLARHAGGDDADRGALDRIVGIGAGHLGVEAVDRRRLREIQRFALRNAFRDIEHHNVAELTQSDEVGERSADLAGADQCNLGTRHGKMNLYVRTVWASRSETRFDFGMTLVGRPRNCGRAVVNVSCHRRQAA